MNGAFIYKVGRLKHRPTSCNMFLAVAHELNGS
jgi:hypothetical protein